MNLDAVAEELYGLHPDAFVPARDDAVARARSAGDRDLAKAIARLRRPTRAAWLANLLARNRAEQLDGLLALSGDLADAQRTLDGGALRALSAQRRRLVGAMAREAGRLAAQAGDSAADAMIRDLEGILDAALADPEVAREVRSGRLTRTVSYSGFGPAEGGPGEPRTGGTSAAEGRAGGGRAGGGRAGAGRAAAVDDGAVSDTATTKTGNEDDERERAEQQRAEHLARERAERERVLADAESEESAAQGRAEEAESARADAEATHADSRARVADLATELEAARERERITAAAAREAGASAKDAARTAGAATTRAERARARLAELG